MESDQGMLNTLQSQTFRYFLNCVNSANGLIADKSSPDSPASIAVAGMGLTCYTIAVERNLLSRGKAAKKAFTLMQFFYAGHQGIETDAMGYKGFYYHFLHMESGKRACDSELSTIDTAILLAGVLTVAQYFTADNKEEAEIRALADRIYRRVDWQWALNGEITITHGWTPESGFLPYRWDRDYSEAMILYILALGSPSFPIKALGYQDWTSTFKWDVVEDVGYLHAGPLFIHQMSHLWLDFQGIRDDWNRKNDIDYFENSRRATLVQQRYAIRNPKNFLHYSKNNWGFTASDGPGPAVVLIDGVENIFYDYIARGIPAGPDDGTISPWAVVASLPFAPDIVLDTIRHAIKKLTERNAGHDGFDGSFNPAFPMIGDTDVQWVSPWKFGLNEGPMVIMIENYHTKLIWELMRQSGPVVRGLRAAGFTGGWLDRLPA